MLRTELIAPIGELLHRHAISRRDKVAYRDAGRSISYGALELSTRRIAGHLVSLGLRRGDAVALLLPNSVDWVEACLAIARAGCVVVPIGHDASPDEIAFRIVDAKVRAIVVGRDRAGDVDAARASAPNLERVLTAGGGDDLDFKRFAESEPDAEAADPDDLDCPAFIIYTSGTTGKPKGVVLGLRGLLWVATSCWAGVCGINEDDVILSALPLSHGYAINLCLLATLAIGARAHIMERFSTSGTIELLRAGELTIVPGVPTMFHYLYDRMRGETGGDAVSLPGFRLGITAGAVMPAKLARDCEAFFGVPMIDGYGISETSSMITMAWPSGTRMPGSCGLPLPGLATRIVDPTSGVDVPFGGEGEFIVRGPGLMQGYLGRPEETERVMRGGWYHTGDLARADVNGFVTITGRIKETIIRGGQNISPSEVEGVAGQFPGVLDCAVAAVPHPQLGEVPALFVIPRPGLPFDEGALIAHCAAHLSAYKVPGSVHIVDAIPRTGSGKVLRFRLAELASADAAPPSSPSIATSGASA